jgi:signal transduction histidine kinase
MAAKPQNALSASETGASAHAATPLSGLIIIGQERVITCSPELARLFPVLIQTRPALAELPAVFNELVRDAQNSIQPVACDIPFSTRGSVVSLCATSVHIGTMPRVVIAVNERPAAAPHLDALRRLDRLASLGTLSASTAHEVRNAFVAVKTFVDLLIERDPDTELAGLVRREMRRIDSLVAQMLRFAAPTQPGRKQIQLHTTLEHALQMVAPNLKSRSITLQKSLNALPGTIAGDDYQIEQALLNLFVNAIEAMGSDGTLTIETMNIAGDDALLTGTEFAGRACTCVLVRDTGPGLSVEARDRLFEPFFTTKTQGTGLGLAITRRIVKENGGDISVSSEPGRGCVFRLLFPNS